MVYLDDLVVYFKTQIMQDEKITIIVGVINIVSSILLALHACFQFMYFTNQPILL